MTLYFDYLVDSFEIFKLALRSGADRVFVLESCTSVF
jgi:hypothetical protein